MELTDFKESIPLTVADFDKIRPAGPNISENTAAQIAGTYSILQGGRPTDYQQTKDDLLNPESRDKFLTVHKNLRDAIWSDAQTSLNSYLVDPNENEQDKFQVINTVKALPSLTEITVSKLPPLSSLETLAQESLVIDNGHNESEHSEITRNSLLTSVTGIIDRKRKVASMVNGLEIGKNPVAVKQMKDLAEFLAPFAEWLHYDRMSAQLEGDQYQLNLLGQQKKALYDKIKTIPLNKRMEYAEAVIELINQNQTLVLPDGNDIAALQDLHRMLIEDDYSNTDRYLDNMSSVLDVVGIGGFFKGLVKGARATKAARVLGEVETIQNVKPSLQVEAQAFKESQQLKATEEASSTLAQEAQNFKGSAEPTAKEVFALKPKLDNSPKKLAEEAANFKSAPEPTEDTVFRDALTEATRTEVSPASPSQVVKDFNPDLARQLHKMAAEDETGEAAKALYGSSKTEALAKDILPEPGIKPKELPEKVEMSGPDFPEPSEIRKIRQEDGYTIVGDAERAKLANKLEAGFKEIEGMTLHPSSMIVRMNEDATIGFTARYSPVDTGFKSARETLDKAKFAFRNYGLQDSNFSLLKKSPDGTWKEISLQDAEALDKINSDKIATGVKGEEANYALGMKYDYRFDPNDWDSAEMLTTAPSIVARAVQFLDRMPGQFLARLGQGSLVQNLLDNASVIHPQILNAGSVAVDRAYRIRSIYVEEFGKFLKDYRSLSKDRKALMTDYIHQANLEGLKLKESNLYARGFTEKEVEALKKWRRANDLMWYAANDDMAISLRANGFMSFTHKDTNTKLFGRPMAAQTAYGEKWIFDPFTNKVVSMEKADIDKLYEQKGTMFRLSDPVQVDGHWVDTVMSPNTPNGGYLRRIHDGEHVLSYRDGYYPVAYDANHIILKQVIKEGGVQASKAIAVARNQNEVKKILKALREQDPKAIYSHRPDRSHNRGVSRIFDEGAWSVSSNSGITSQRIRGERLQEIGVDLEKMGKAHLKDPLEAVQMQLHQLSQRVAVRPYLDAVKKRWMLNYGDYIDLKVNPKTGNIDMPSSITDVVGKADAPDRLVADARTNFNYISSLENGYINLIDEGYRGLMQVFAKSLGASGWGKGEEALFKASTQVPSQTVRSLSFKLMLAASPFRQAIVQRGQILQLAVVNPAYFPKMMVDLVGLNQVRYGFSKSNYYKELLGHVENSGILEAVDAHNLIRDDLLQLADLSTGQQVRNAIGAPLRFTQKIGFDAAEQDVLLSAWLSFRDLAVKAGKNVNDQRIKDEILGKARAFTLNMNRAGEMPYSRNTLSVVAQFFAFQHKAMLQGITNSSLSKMDRVKLLGFTTAMWGVGATPFAVAYSLIPKDTPPEVRAPLEQGLFTMVMNKGLTMLSGKDQAIDWRDMAPSEAYGIGNVFVGMLDTPIVSILMEGPTSSLFFGANPKLTDSFKTGFKYFVPAADYEDPELQVKFTDVLRTSASTFSGFSALFKARYAFQTGKKLSSTGKVTDDDVSGIEAFMASAGFRTLHETSMAATKELMYGDKAFEDNDVTSWYMELKRHLARRGDTVAETDMAQRVLGEAWNVFNDDRPRAVELIRKQLAKDAENGDYLVIKGIVSQMGFVTEEETWDKVNALPDGPAKQNLIETMHIREDLNNGD